MDTPRLKNPRKRAAASETEGKCSRLYRQQFPISYCVLKGQNRKTRTTKV